MKTAVRVNTHSSDVSVMIRGIEAFTQSPLFPTLHHFRRIEKTFDRAILPAEHFYYFIIFRSAPTRDTDTQETPQQYAFSSSLSTAAATTTASFPSLCTHRAVYAI